MKTFTITITQRAVLTKHGVPVRALTPGKHAFWSGAYDVVRFERTDLIFDAAPELRAVMPAAWYAEATVGPRQRGVLWKHGRPARFLRPGTHRYWTGDDSVELRVYDVDQPVPELTDELRALIPAAELLDVTVQQHQRGLKYVNGRFAEQLGPGRYLCWNPPDAKVAIAVLDTRRQLLNVPAPGADDQGQGHAAPDADARVRADRSAGRGPRRRRPARGAVPRGAAGGARLPRRDHARRAARGPRGHDPLPRGAGGAARQGPSASTSRGSASRTWAAPRRDEDAAQPRHRGREGGRGQRHHPARGGGRHPQHGQHRARVRPSSRCSSSSSGSRP
jgi:hypothetical protein